MNCSIKNLEIVFNYIKQSHLDNQTGSDFAQFDNESDLKTAVENAIESIEESKK